MDDLGLDVDDEFDLNEIESRLYSQVYHGNADDELESTACYDNTDTTLSAISTKQKYRYFANRIQTGIRPDDHTNASIFNKTLGNSFSHPNLTVLTPTVDFNIYSNGYQNIINQFTIPVIITDRLNSDNPGNLNEFDFGNFNTSVENVTSCNVNKVLTRKEKTQLRNRKRAERRKSKHLNKNSLELNTKIIFISDESADECILINEGGSNMASKKIESEKIEQEIENLDDNDDIIYIPPPPMQIINIDEEEVETVSEIPSANDKCETLINETNKSIPPQGIPHTLESTSNDFLDNSPNENAVSKFNFALHGSDFSSSSEFVRPNSNNDCYETESSCSTNDHNKDFNNSAKSIVFDEVEFPKEDIFSDKNLDSFGSFITPNRNSKSSENNLASLPEKNINIDSIESDSSSSSTESDYEPSVNKTSKTLPTLSPMLTPQELSRVNCTPKPNKKKSKDINVSSPNGRSLSKRKPDGEDLQTHSNKSFKKLKKNKKLEDVNNSVSEIELSQEIQHSGEEELRCDSLTKKKKKRKNCSPEDESNKSQIKDIVESDPRANSTYSENRGGQEQIKKKKRKRKKTKKSVNIDEEQLEISQCDPETTSTNSEVNISGAVDEEHTISSEKDAKNINEATAEHPYDNLDAITDPSGINFFNSTIDNADSHDDDIIVVQNESKASDDVILIDDKSDSEVELIENIDCVDLTNLELANCSANTASTPGGIFNANPNEESGDYLDNFDVQVIQSKQSDDPQKWLVSYKDRSTYLVMEKKGPRCNRCRHFGHIGSKCPDKPHPPCCSLCSGTNHQEPRCPNKVCRQCGNPGDYSTSYCYLCFKYRHVKCNLCNVPGHISKSCPDQWRRYHLTTEAGPIVTPEQQVMRPRNQQWCSGCAQQGHLEHECNDTYYHREFPPTRPDIVTYIDILSENESINQRNAPYAPENEPPTPTIPNALPLYRIPSLFDNIVTINSNQLPGFGRTVTPNTISSNIIIQVPNLVPNPYVQQNILNSALIESMKSNFQNPFSTDIIQQMRNNFQNPVTPNVEETVATSRDPSKFDMRKIQELFMSMPHATVKNFVRKQVEELDNNIINYNPKILRHKLFKYDKISEGLTEKRKKDRLFWFRVLNMFIFGVHNLNDGKLHVRFIRNFLASKKAQEFDETRRRSLFNSYSYVFGVDKHTNVNYYRLIKLLIDRCSESKVVKPL